MTTQALPDWYSRSTVDTPISAPRAGRRAGLPVRRALARLGEALARELSSPPCTESWLGRIEPRAKVIGLLLPVFASTFLHALWSLAVLLAIVLIVAVSIRLPPRRLIHVWLGVPLFSLAIIIPAATNLVTPGKTVVTLWHFEQATLIGPWVLPKAITVTSSGLMVAGRFLLRSLDCVTLSYLLIATTDPIALLNGLRRLGMPKVFGMVLTMAERYLAVLLRVAEEIHLAKLSRTIAAGSLRSEQRWVAAGIGILFRRTHRLAQEVQNAMTSRGYDGDLQVRSQSVIRLRHLLWLFAVMTLTVALVVLDRLGARSPC